MNNWRQYYGKEGLKAFEKEKVAEVELARISAQQEKDSNRQTIFIIGGFLLFSAIFSIVTFTLVDSGLEAENAELTEKVQKLSNELNACQGSKKHE